MPAHRHRGVVLGGGVVTPRTRRQLHVLSGHYACACASCPQLEFGLIGAALPVGFAFISDTSAAASAAAPAISADSAPAAAVVVTFTFGAPSPPLPVSLPPSARGTGDRRRGFSVASSAAALDHPAPMGCGLVRSGRAWRVQACEAASGAQ